MKINNGIDIIEVERIKNNIEKYGEQFLNKVFTENEIKYCESKKVQKYQSYAARFAAKEATFKAVSAWLENKYELEWKDIEVLNNEQGRPYIKLNFEKLCCENVKLEISISHVKEMAIASVIAYLE